MAGLRTKMRHLINAILIIFALVGMVMVCSNRASAESKLTMISLRMIGDNNLVRLIAVFNQKPNFTLQTIAKPTQLVIDLETTQFQIKPELVKTYGMIDRLRFGTASATSSRIIFDVSAPFSVANNKIQKLDSDLWQVIIDLKRVSEADFENIVSARTNTDEARNTTINKAPYRPFRLVLDPGHGGIDSGAKGITGVLEKNVTLAFAKTLRDSIEREPGIDVLLTRDSDVFLRLDERVEKARAFGADLFISIHADSISVKSLRGTTVYTLSNKASDDVAHQLANSQNKADLVAGLPPDETPEVTDILIDLTRRETHVFSVNFANKVVATLSTNHVRLIKNPHRAAGFRVLKAPDIPSVLIELGYLSNRQDEKLVSDPKWRRTMADLLAKSIRKFANYRRASLE